MTEIVRHVDGQFSAEPTDALKARLSSILSRTADDLREMAMIVGELEARGEDLSALRLGMVDHLRRIAAGQLLPELVVRFAGDPALLRRVAVLPLPDQRRVATGEPMAIAVWRAGAVDWRMIDPLALTPSQASLVFSRDRLRTKAEQVSLLEERAAKPVKKRGRPKLGKVRADAARGGLVVGRTFAALDEVLRALAELGQADYDDDAEGKSKLLVELPASEHQQVKMRAARAKCSMSQLVRRAMAAHGLFASREERLRESAERVNEQHGETFERLAE